MNATPSSAKPGFIESIPLTWESTSGKVIILANLVPAISLLLFNWSTYTVAFLYWAENVIIGCFQVLRMILAQGTAIPVPARAAEKLAQADQPAPALPRALPGIVKIFLIPFFIVHYGGFCAGHGVFVTGIFGGAFTKGQALRFAPPPNIELAIVALIAMHAIMFFKDYVIDQEWRTASVPTLMMEPYGRIVALHIGILGSAFLVMITGLSPNILLAVIFAKTAWDCRLDARRRFGLGNRAEAVPAA